MIWYLILIHYGDFLLCHTNTNICISKRFLIYIARCPKLANSGEKDHYIQFPTRDSNNFASNFADLPPFFLFSTLSWWLCHSFRGDWAERHKVLLTRLNDFCARKIFTETTGIRTWTKKNENTHTHTHKTQPVSVSELPTCVRRIRMAVSRCFWRPRAWHSFHISWPSSQPIINILNICI